MSGTDGSTRVSACCTGGACKVLSLCVSSKEEAINVYAIIIVLCISIDNSNIKTKSLRNTQSQET
jgi:hypothetical protein